MSSQLDRILVSSVKREAVRHRCGLFSLCGGNIHIETQHGS